MSDEHEMLRKRIKEKSIDDLKGILAAPAGQYRDETVQYAREELTRRERGEGQASPAQPSDAQQIISAPMVKVESPVPAVPAILNLNASSHLKIPRSGSVRTLKDECIRKHWASMVHSGAGHGNVVLGRIHDRLLEARIPGDCQWVLQEVKSAGLLSRTRREFLIVTWDQFADYQNYVCIRDFGIHLDCLWVQTIEANMLKKWVSEKLTEDADSLSAPKNILVYQDLNAWTAIVQQAVTASVHELMTALGQDTAALQPGSKGFMNIW